MIIAVFPDHILGESMFIDWNVLSKIFFLHLGQVISHIINGSRAGDNQLSHNVQIPGHVEKHSGIPIKNIGRVFSVPMPWFRSGMDDDIDGVIDKERSHGDFIHQLQLLVRRGEERILLRQERLQDVFAQEAATAGE
jgi:hypothetical protein